MTMKDAIEQYRQLRDDVDRQADLLFEAHSHYMQCRRQCTDCCINLTVWPVEFFAILEDLRAAAVKPVFDAKASCGFLKDGLCQIYAFRPIICRTHGLPLVYLDDEADEPVHGVTFCQKNFTGLDADAIAFGPANTLDMDAVNETLARLHTAFLDAGGQSGPDGDSRIALAALVKFV